MMGEKGRQRKTTGGEKAMKGEKERERKRRGEKRDNKRENKE